MNESKIETATICPALGLRDDHTTCFAYPNPLNCCHRAETPQPVTEEYQKKFCLSARHLNCPVYSSYGKNVQWAGLHKSGRTFKLPVYKWRKILITFGVPLLIISLSIIGLFTVQLNPSAAVQFISDEEITMEQSENPSTQAIIQVALESPTIQPKTPTPGPGMGTPFGPTLVSAGRYILHEVQPGETLNELARKYHTSLLVLGAANPAVEAFLKAESMLASADVKIVGGQLMAGTVLVVMPWRIDPNGVPQFRVIDLSENALVDDLAKREGISAGDLRYYNDLGEDLWIPAGRSLIIAIEN